MIRCPKCNFEQPPDEYCARCVVYISTYKVPPAPWSRKLTGSGGFYMFLLATVIIASIYMIFSRSTQNEVSSITTTAALPPPIVETPSPSTTLEPTIAEKTVEKSTETVAPQPEVLTEKLATKIEKEEGPPEPIAAPLAARSAAPTSKIHVTAYFLEVPQNSINTLFAGAGDSTTGIVSNFSTHLTEAIRNAEGKLRTLSQSEKNIESANVQIRFDHVLNENTALYIRVSPTAISETQVNADIHIEYRTLGPQGTPITQEFDGAFVLPNAAAAYFADVFPHNPVIRPEDASLYSNNPVFKVLTSPTYLTNSSEFLIFFEVNGLSE